MRCRTVVACGDGAGLVEQRVHQLVADRDQQLLLGAEVVVQAAGSEAELVGELGHRGLVIALAREDAGGVEHDLRLAAVVALPQGGAVGLWRHPDR